MSIPIQADVPPLYEDDEGVVTITGTRIPLERVIHAFRAGATPEQMAQDFDVLTLASIYSVINYYLHHRQAVDGYLLAAKHEVSALRDTTEQQFDATGVRARLMARGKNSTG